MIADFFTKPIQGLRFQYLRDAVLNIKPLTVHRSVLGSSNLEDAQSEGLTASEQIKERVI